MIKKTVSACLPLILLGGCSAIQYDEGIADRLLSEGKEREAYTHYQYLAKFGLPKAQRKLAQLYQQQGNDHQALIWLSEAAASGDLSAQLKRARLLAFSQDPNVRDVIQGSKLILRLIDQGYDAAIKDLVKLLASDHDYSIPEKYLVIALAKAQQGQPEACYLFAEMYTNGQAPQLSGQQAKGYYLCATKRYEKALYGLSVLYNQQPDLGTFEQVYQLLKASNNASAKNVGLKIAKKIADGTLVSWSSHNADVLFHWLAKTDAHAYFYLAKLYLNKPTIGKDFSDVIAVILEAKVAGDLDCYALEAEIYLYGIQTIQDPWRAEKLLLAIPQSSPYINFLLGALYSEGFLGEPHYPKALAYLGKSALSGFKRADRQLSKIYSGGRGIKVDLIAATKYQLLSKINAEKLALFKQKFHISELGMAEATAQAQRELNKRLASQINNNKDQQI